MSVPGLAAAEGIFWSCQKNETFLNHEKGLMLKDGIIIPDNIPLDVDCATACLDDGSYYQSTTLFVQ